MLSVAKFDLWKRDDVAEHSDAILGRLEDGSMPCDQAWPDDQVALFRRWMDAGKPELRVRSREALGELLGG